MGKHVDKLVNMRKNPRSLQYNGRSWSASFECPACGRIVKKNLNFLGQKAVLCNGRRTFEERVTVSQAKELQANLIEILGGEVARGLAFPRLTALQESGKIQIDRGHYVGLACDGPVELGSVGDEESLENYLASYPTPATW